MIINLRTKRSLFGVIFFATFSIAQENIDHIVTRFYYPDSTVSSEGTMLNNQPQGIWKSYYPEGKIKSIAHWNKGKREGVTTFFSTDSILIKTIDFSNDLKNGYVVEYDSTGNIASKFPYENDTLHGVAYRYFASGEVFEEFTYVKGKLQGAKHVFDSNDGRLIEVVRYENDSVSSTNLLNQLNDKDEKSGYWQERDDKGKLIREGNYINGKEHGSFRIYDTYGKVTRLEEYQFGKLVENKVFATLSMQRVYYENGNLAAKGPVKEGMKIGVHNHYDTSGVYSYSLIYSNDTLQAKGKMNDLGEYDSLWHFYYSDNKIKNSGEYIQGKKHGKWRFYYPSEKLTQVGIYREDLPHGNWIWYYSNGQIKAEETFYKGKLQGEKVEYDSLGKILTRGNYIDDIKDGEWFYDVGDHTESGLYVMGRREGEWMYYHDNKTLVFKGKYKDDLPIGKHKEWYGNGKIKEIRRYKNNGQKHGKWIKYYPDSKIEYRLYYKNGNLVNIDGQSVKKSK